MGGFHECMQRMQRHAMQLYILFNCLEVEKHYRKNALYRKNAIENYLEVEKHY